MKKRKLQMKKRVDLQTILTAIIIFFISRAFLPGGIIPFGFAAFAAAAIIYQFELIPSLIFAAGALAGLATLKQGWQVLVVFLSILFFWGFVRITELLSKSRFKQSLALLLCHSVAILIVVCIQGFILMDVFKGLIQCAISLISFLIFISVVSSFSDDISRKIMTNEEMACIAISVSIAVMGFPDLVLFTLSIRRLIVIVLIMVFSYRGGLGTGAATGVTAGILMA
ncbi:MAG: hypothetical protein LBI03_11335, partial [Clostridiales bacterium]|nr:hypothetical protein [Clostridiales bacterium]